MNKELMDALKVLEREKNISKEVMFQAIEDSLLQACKHHFGKNENIRINMNHETGDYELFAEKEIVEEVEDSVTQISLPNARNLDSKAILGGIIRVPIESKEFGRIATTNAKGVILQKIREEESKVVMEYYRQMDKMVVSGVISRKFEKRPDRFGYDRSGGDKAPNITINLGRAEATLAASEQVPGEDYEIGKRIKVYVLEVKEGSKAPRINVSRTHPDLVKRLFEAEVPEIQEGIVEIKAISREAGSRTKMAVWSKNGNVVAIGSCVGSNSARVNAVVEELHGEKIDIISWDENAAQLIENALSPAKVICVAADEEEKSAVVIVPDNQLSLAIGKAGQNARLAAKLTGYKIDIKSESQAMEEGLLEEMASYEEEYEEELGEGQDWTPESERTEIPETVDTVE